MSNQLGFYLQQGHCVGCFTCQIACKDKNDLAVGQRFRRVHEFAGGGFTQTDHGFVNNVYAYWLSMACNHCENPACVANCPTGAMQKRPEDGIVFVDQSRCVGCQYCVMSCPYGAPQFNPKIGKTGKCDFCRDLLEKGEQPACVAACPMRVLHFGPIDELRRKYQGTDQIQGMPDPDRTNPSIIIAPHRDAVIGYKEAKGNGR